MRRSDRAAPLLATDTNPPNAPCLLPPHQPIRSRGERPMIGCARRVAEKAGIRARKREKRPITSRPSASGVGSTAGCTVIESWVLPRLCLYLSSRGRRASFLVGCAWCCSLLGAVRSLRSSRLGWWAGWAGSPMSSVSRARTRA